MYTKNEIEKEQKLVLMMLEQLSYIMRYVNEAIYYGSKTIMMTSYLIESLIPHDTDEPCDFEPCEIKDIFNSFKDAEIQLKKMHATMDITSEILWDFNNSFDELMINTGIFYTKTDYVDALLLDYKNYYPQKSGGLDDE